MGQQLVEHRFDEAMEVLAGGGQGNAACAALEKHSAEMVFKQADLFGYRALGEEQFARGTGETAGAGHGFEGDQGVERGQVAAVAAHG
ncbi:hypothetical protein D3C71_2031130 [compost metagenome]